MNVTTLDAPWKTNSSPWEAENKTLPTRVHEENRTPRDSTDAIIRSLYAERSLALRELRTTPEHLSEKRDRLRAFADDLERTIHDLQRRELEAQPRSDVWDEMDRLATRVLALGAKFETSTK